MSNLLRVGQKVTLVRDWDDQTRRESVIDGITLPEKGVVYTIRNVGFFTSDEPYVRLVEIVNPILTYFENVTMEQGFDPTRFRPVVERKANIGIFQALLVPSKVEEPA